MKTILALAILASIAASPAAAERFTHDGVSYNYEVMSVGGVQIISGANLSSGEAFRLRVKGDDVSGRFGEWPVQFRMTAAEIAANARSGLMLAAK